MEAALEAIRERTSGIICKIHRHSPSFHISGDTVTFDFCCPALKMEIESVIRGEQENIFPHTSTGRRDVRWGGFKDRFR